jgi:iron(III) transport system ATP-binding protein
MTVLQNVAYGLKFQGMRRKQAREKSLHYLEMVGMADCADAAIHQLSGGQQQRTALARALVVEPKLCLLDEPFSNLDAALRAKMRTELKALQKKLGMTMAFVTHDQEEALLLADKMVIMNEGELVQQGAPMEILRAPANGFVASFLGVSQLRWEPDGTLLKVIQ